MQLDQKLSKDNNNAFYLSSKFLPKKYRNDIYKLYSFVSITKSYASENQAKKLQDLEKSYNLAISDTAFDAIAHKWDDTDTRIIKYIVRLQNKHKFEQSWVETYFKSLRIDLDKQEYKTIDQLLEFVYGSAEVVSLMTAKILNMSEDIYEAVQAEGRALLWLDFVRNIAKQNKQGKLYFPTDELKKYNLADLGYDTIQASPEKFNKFIQLQINRYHKWQSQVNKSIQLVPERLQVPVRTIIDVNDWVAKKIATKPIIVYQKMVNPSKQRVVRQIIKNSAKGSARVGVRTTRKVGRGVKNIRPASKAVIPKIKQAPETVKEKAKEIKDKYIETED